MSEVFKPCMISLESIIWVETSILIHREVSLKLFG